MAKAFLLVLFLTVLAMAGSARADYPDKPIRFVMTQAAGSPADVVARMVTAEVTRLLGQPIIIDNRPGGSGLIAAQIVQKAAPDGYTVLGFSSTFAGHPGLFKQMPYDLHRDFIPLVRAVIVPLVVVVHPSLPVKDMAELVEYAKREPGGLNYATGGNSSSPHIAGELFKSRSGAPMTHVPYKSDPGAIADTLSGEVKVTWTSTSGTLAHIRAGKLRAIAVSSPARFDVLPDVPTIAESGYAGFELVGWYGYMLPARTPAPVVSKLGDAIRAALARTEIKERLTGLGLIVAPTQSPEDFGAYIDAETRKTSDVIRAARIQAD